MACSTGSGESEFLDAQCQQESSGIRFGVSGGKIFGGHFTENRGKGFAGEAEFFAAAFCIKLGKQTGNCRLHCSGDRFRGAHVEQTRVRRTLPDATNY